MQNRLADLGFDEIYELVPNRVYEIYHKGRVFRMYVCESMDNPNHRWSNRFDELFDVNGERVWRQLLGVPETRHATDEVTCVGQGLGWLRNYVGLRP